MLIIGPRHTLQRAVRQVFLKWRQPVPGSIKSICAQPTVFILRQSGKSHTTWKRSVINVFFSPMTRVNSSRFVKNTCDLSSSVKRPCWKTVISRARLRRSFPMPWSWYIVRLSAACLFVRPGVIVSTVIGWSLYWQEKFGVDDFMPLARSIKRHSTLIVVRSHCQGKLCFGRQIFSAPRGVNSILFILFVAISS